VISTLGRVRPLAAVAVRSATQIAVTLVLIFVLFPAVLAAAAPRVPIGG
jgi:hypothetical protein